jgi:hypothetical protein
LHAAQLGVELRDGIVTLSAEVGSHAEKWNAERTVQRLPGVRVLAVELAVKLSEFGRRTDADSAQSARNILGWTSARTRPTACATRPAPSRCKPGSKRWSGR